MSVHEPLPPNLNADEERFRAAFDQSIMGMALTDLQGALLRVNSAFCRTVGRPPEEIVGRNSHHMTHPEDRDNNVEAIRQLREGKTSSATYHKRYIRPDGALVWTRVNLSVVRNAQGRPDSLIATVEDITEQKRAQRALQEQEEHLRLLFESLTDYAIFTVDEAGLVTNWNSGAERIFGYSTAEILHHPCDVLWTPEDRAAGVPELERREAGDRGSADDERWHQRKDGSRFYASGAMRPMHAADGGLRGFIKICRDVTAQREAEIELAAARERVAAVAEAERARLAEVFQQSPSFMAVLRGPQHVFEMANERYYQLVGRRDILGKPLGEALPEIEQQGFGDLLDRVYATGEPYVGKGVRVLLQRQPGCPPDECCLDFVYQATRDAQGAVTGVFAHGVDITERVAAERSLQQQSRTFDTALSSIKDYVFTMDRSGRFIYANKALLDLWGLPAEKGLGKSMRELHYSAEVEEQIRRNVERVYESRRTVVDETTYVSPTGVSGVFEYILAPVIGPDGQVELAAGTSRDITERKRVEKEREQLLESERAARSEAERASRMKDEFLATLSHELRTPLNAILGWTTILRSHPEPEEIPEGLEVIERNARAQTQIIEDLLDMSRIISGKVRLDVRRIDLATVVEAAVETVRPAAQAKGVRLLAVLDPLAGPVTGDPNRLQQVFWNLLSNAVKFTPREGRVQVLLERVNSHLEVSVVDTGEGIRPEFLPHVFDRFRQADASTTRRHGGLGLGLAIVKQLVELHGGSVRVKSGGPGLGTAFTVALPLTALHPPAESENERRHPASGAPASLKPLASLRLDGLKVLVVDDEPDARALVARLLEGSNAAVLTAGSAEEALRIVEAEKPDVLVSDIGMPGEDGYSLIRRVRALGPERGGGVPAVALTAYARAEDRMKAVLAGFQMHVAKPAEPAELLTMVASLGGRTPGA